MVKLNKKHDSCFKHESVKCETRGRNVPLTHAFSEPMRGLVTASHAIRITHVSKMHKHDCFVLIAVYQENMMWQRSPPYTESFLMKRKAMKSWCIKKSRFIKNRSMEVGGVYVSCTLTKFLCRRHAVLEHMG